VPTINNLSEVSSLSAGDAIPVYASAQGDARKASLSTLLAFVEANFASPDYTTQINAPSSSGSSIALADQTGNLWLIINPTGAFAALTLVLPTSGNAYDGQQILVTCSNSIGALTINPNGATRLLHVALQRPAVDVVLRLAVAGRHVGVLIDHTDERYGHRSRRQRTDLA
jgi:hypothetical protein